MKQVAIIDYGAGNVQSVQFAFERLGIKTVVTSDSSQIQSASHVIFPGVGHAKAAKSHLIETGLIDFIKTLNQPVLGICLGMQLLCNQTEEGPTKGLQVFNTNVVKFDVNLKVPAVGWALVKSTNHPLFESLDNEQFYFVHSYYAQLSEQTIGLADYQISYSAALANRNFLGVQFHPERSGEAGEQLLTNFLKLT
ncbi:imidazole glycerol phosphate synthase subunit HisH [Flavobacteriaceae bacterium]|nr:imidazole glycerol phosphate synthase subunit HisH [Flavobacteriaceae bacterium]